MLNYYLQKRGGNTDGCSLNMTVSALACAISKGKSEKEITLLSVFFTQLGDGLATIAAADAFCENNAETTDVLNIT